LAVKIGGWMFMPRKSSAVKSVPTAGAHRAVKESRSERRSAGTKT
jgi:hypothetical protein